MARNNQCEFFEHQIETQFKTEVFKTNQPAKFLKTKFPVWRYKNFVMAAFNKLIIADP